MGHKTLQDFAQDLRGPNVAAEWRGSWATALLYRRPGVVLAWILARWQVHPATVTLAAFLLALSLPLQAWLWPFGAAPWLVCLSAMVFQILDCTDGTLARHTGQTSQRGADMDFLVDMAQWALLYLAIGILADRQFDTGYLWTAIAAVAAWSRLMARVTRDCLDSGDKGAPSTPTLKDYPSLFLGGISGLIPLFALAGSWLHWVVVALLIYALLDIIEGAMPLFRK